MSSSFETEPFPTFPGDEPAEAPDRETLTEPERLATMAEFRERAPRLLGRSVPIRYINERSRRIAASDLPVFIHGELGTGKERLATILHALSPRAEHGLKIVRLKAVDDARLQEELLSEARRDEVLRELQGGTLLLDEVCDASPETQLRLVGLLRDLENPLVRSWERRPPDARLVATSSTEPERAVAAGRLRSDLYHLLHVVPLHLPPLRQRPEDVAPLALHFAEREAATLKKREAHLSREVLTVLEGHRWHGNVRELENVIRAAVLSATDQAITVADIKALLSTTLHVAERWEEPFLEALQGSIGSGGAYRKLLSAAEHVILKEALRQSSGNKVRAAALLGIHRNSLARRVAALDVVV